MANVKIKTNKERANKTFIYTVNSKAVKVKFDSDAVAEVEKEIADVIIFKDPERVQLLEPVKTPPSKKEDKEDSKNGESSGTTELSEEDKLLVEELKKMDLNDLQGLAKDNKFKKKEWEALELEEMLQYIIGKVTKK